MEETTHDCGTRKLIEALGKAGKVAELKQCLDMLKDLAAANSKAPLPPEFYALMQKFADDLNTENSVDGD